jgi:phosphoribosyl-ATP pyrophosphohydrolase
MESIQEQIRKKEREIKAAELLLDKLNKEAEALYRELEDLEAMRLIRKMDDQGLSIEDVLDLIK